MSQFKSISGATSNVDDNAYVNYVFSKPRSDRKSTSKQKNDRNAKHDKPRTGEKKAQKCKFGGEQHPMKKESCLAWQQKYWKCSGRNHFAKMSCKDSPHDVYGIGDYELAPEGSADESDESNDSHYDFLSGIDILEFDNINMIDDKAPYKRFVYTEMFINKDKVIFQVNCGTSVNIVNEKYMKGKAVQPTTKVLKMWNGSHLKPIGITDRLIVWS